MTAAVAVALLTGAGAPPQEMSAWQRDLDYLTTVLPQVHGDAFHTTSPAEFDSSAAALHARLPVLAGPVARAEMAALVAMVGDGHTRVNLLTPGGDGVPAEPDSGYVPLPIRAYRFADGLYVRAARPEAADLLGARIVGVGGLPIEEVLDRLERYTHRDNAMTVRLLAPVLLMRPAFLRAAGVIDAGTAVPFQLVSRDGRPMERVLRPSPSSGPDAGGEWTDGANAAGSEPPLWRRRNDEFYWFEAIDGGQTLYLQFNAVRDSEPESLAAFATRVGRFLATHPVDRMIVDLRNNNGGNWVLAVPLIDAIDASAVNRRGSLFVVTGRATFSAAVVVAALLEDRTEAVVVGEPTGARPNTWGDLDTFTLPESGLSVSYSERFFQSGGPYDERPWIAPEIAAEPTWSEYETGWDPVVAAIAGYEPGPPLGEQLQRALREEGPDAAIAVYDAFTSRPEHRWYWAHDDLSDLGIRLWLSDRVAESIPVWERMAAHYPESAEGPENLAETYASLGDREAALAALETALRIEPRNGDALELLQELCGHAAVARLVVTRAAAGAVAAVCADGQGSR